MFSAPIESTLAESSAVAVAAALSPSSSTSDSSFQGWVDENRGFNGLRSVKWRMNLGILPSSSSSSVDDLRRVTADSSRR